MNTSIRSELFSGSLLHMDLEFTRVISHDNVITHITVNDHSPKVFLSND